MGHAINCFPIIFHISLLKSGPFIKKLLNIRKSFSLEDIVQRVAVRKCVRNEGSIILAALFSQIDRATSQLFSPSKSDFKTEKNKFDRSHFSHYSHILPYPQLEPLNLNPHCTWTKKCSRRFCKNEAQLPHKEKIPKN